MEVLDPELKTYFSKIKEEIKSEHVQYIQSHPEIRDILNDFLSSLLLEKPEDICLYARKYFSFFNVDKTVENQNLLVISGPSGVGKAYFSSNFSSNLFCYVVWWILKFICKFHLYF